MKIITAIFLSFTWTANSEWRSNFSKWPPFVVANIIHKLIIIFCSPKSFLLYPDIETMKLKLGFDKLGSQIPWNLNISHHKNLDIILNTFGNFRRRILKNGSMLFQLTHGTFSSINIFCTKRMFKYMQWIHHKSGFLARFIIACFSLLFFHNYLRVHDVWGRWNDPGPPWPV